MDSQWVQALIEALVKLFNPKIVKVIEEERLERDCKILKTIQAMGCSINSLEYKDGRLDFKATPASSVIDQYQIQTKIESRPSMLSYETLQDKNKLILEERTKEYDDYEEKKR